MDSQRIQWFLSSSFAPEPWLEARLPGCSQSEKLQVQSIVGTGGPGLYPGLLRLPAAQDGRPEDLCPALSLGSGPCRLQGEEEGPSQSSSAPRSAPPPRGPRGAGPEPTVPTLQSRDSAAVWEGPGRELGSRLTALSVPLGLWWRERLRLLQGSVRRFPGGLSLWVEAHICPFPSSRALESGEVGGGAAWMHEWGAGCGPGAGRREAGAGRPRLWTAEAACRSAVHTA